MKKTSALRNTFYSSVAMYTEFVLGMVTSIVIARHLGPEVYGSYSAAIWLVGLGIALTNSGTASAAIRFIAELRGKGQGQRSGPLLTRLQALQRKYLLIVLSTLALVIALAGRHIVPMYDHRWLYGFLVVAIALRSSYMFRIGVAKGHEDFRSVALIALVAAPLNLLFVLLIIVLDKPESWLLLAFLVSSVVFFMLSRRRTRAYMHDGDEALDAATELRVRRQVAFSTLIVSLGFLAASEVEVSLLNAFDLSHDAGQFKVAHQLATGAASLVPGVFGALMLPMMARALSEGANVAGQRFASSTTYLLLLAAPLAAFGCVLGPSLVQVLYGAQYAASSHWFPLLLASTCLLASTAAGSSLLISADRQNVVLAVLVACAGFKLLMGSALIHHFALAGAVTSFALTSVANAASTMYMAGKVTHGRLQWGRMARVLLAAGIAALTAWPLAAWLAPMPAVLLGGTVFALAYAGGTLALQCWQADDLDVMRGLVARLPTGGAAMGGRAIDWAHARAARDKGGA